MIKKISDTTIEVNQKVKLEILNELASDDMKGAIIIATDAGLKYDEKVVKLGKAKDLLSEHAKK